MHEGCAIFIGTFLGLTLLLMLAFIVLVSRPLRKPLKSSLQRQHDTLDTLDDSQYISLEELDHDDSLEEQESEDDRGE